MFVNYHLIKEKIEKNYPYCLALKFEYCTISLFSVLLRSLKNANILRMVVARFWTSILVCFTKQFSVGKY